MTSILTRQPLEHMPPNRAAHGHPDTALSRRRSVRTFDDDNGGDGEDAELGAPPAKKLKAHEVDRGEARGAAAGKTNGAPTRRTRKAYDEADDGFTFSRTKSKRGAKAQAAEPRRDAARQENQSTTPKATETATANRKRPRKTLPVTPDRHDNKPPVRRSTRLSGETQVRSDADPNDPFVTRTGRKGSTSESVTKAQRQLQQTQDGSPAVGLNGNAAPDTLHVEKKRPGFTRITLAMGETPIIRRNREMRRTLVHEPSKQEQQSHRRSSAGLRGKRASSLMDNGSSSALPHTEVPTHEFYKHIGQDLLEPKRMRQLLVWCANRVLGERRKGARIGKEMDVGEVQAQHSARVVEEELLAELTNRSELSNWFDRTDDSAQSNVSLVKKPNPRNVQNATKLIELEAELTRLQAEKKSWDDLIASVPTARRQSSVANGEDNNGAQPLEPASIDTSLLDPSQAALLANLLNPFPASEAVDTDHRPTGAKSAHQSASSATQVHIQTRLDTASSNLHFKLDLLSDSLHRLERYVDTAGRAAARVGELSAQRLGEREDERAARLAGGVGAVGERDLLRALGRALNGAGGPGAAGGAKGS